MSALGTARYEISAKANQYFIHYYQGTLSFKYMHNLKAFSYVWRLGEVLIKIIAKVLHYVSTCMSNYSTSTFYTPKYITPYCDSFCIVAQLTFFN